MAAKRNKSFFSLRQDCLPVCFQIVLLHGFVELYFSKEKIIAEIVIFGEEREDMLSVELEQETDFYCQFLFQLVLFICFIYQYNNNDVAINLSKFILKESY